MKQRTNFVNLCSRLSSKFCKNEIFKLLKLLFKGISNKRETKTKICNPSNQATTNLNNCQTLKCIIILRVFKLSLLSLNKYIFSIPSVKHKKLEKHGNVKCWTKLPVQKLESQLIDFDLDFFDFENEFSRFEELSIVPKYFFGIILPR